MVTVTFQIKPLSSGLHVHALQKSPRRTLQTALLPHFPRSIFSTPSPSTTFSTSYPFPTLPTPHGTKPKYYLHPPHPRNGKNPNVYNYIGHNSALIIEKAMEVEMRAELYEFLLKITYCHGIMFKKNQWKLLSNIIIW